MSKHLSQSRSGEYFDKFRASRRRSAMERARQPLVAMLALASLLAPQCVLAPAMVWAQGRSNPASGKTEVREVLKPGRIKPSQRLRKANQPVSPLKLDLSRVPTEAELQASGGLGGAMSPIGNADVEKLAVHLNRELIQAGIRGGLKAQAPLATPAGRLLHEAREKIKRLEAINLSFGRAVRERNARHFPRTAELMARHLEEFPDSPWAGEANLHLGMNAMGNGRPSQAQAYFEAILKLTSVTPEGGALAGEEAGGKQDVRPATEDSAHDVRQKAKVGLSELDIRLNRRSDASRRLRDILKTDNDWRRRTWAFGWLHRMSQEQPQANRQAAACGTEALAVMFASLGKQSTAEKLARMMPPRDSGFSMAELAKLAAQNGVPMKGFRARPEQLASLPLPALIHYRIPSLSETAEQPAPVSAKEAKLVQATQKTGLLICEDCPEPGGRESAQERSNEAAAMRHAPDNHSLQAMENTGAGHFVVVQKVEPKTRRVHVHDPQGKKSLVLTYDQLAKESSGAGLMLADSGRAEGRIASLSLNEMKGIFGGCCCTPRPPGDLGPGPENQPGGPGGGNGAPGSGGPTDCGSPVWSINRVTLNLFITDTPLWYAPPVGPAVSINMSYNSQDGLNHSNAFGNKWSFNYGSYLMENPDGAVTLFMPGGRQNVYLPDGSGGYISPAGVFLNLTKISTDRFELTAPEGDKWIYDIPSGISTNQPYLVEIRDRFNQSLNFGYQAQNGHVNLTAIEDAQGKITELEYDGDGHIIRVTDPFERHATFSYDGNGNMVQVVDMEGNPFQYTYDSDVLITQLNTVQGAWDFTHSISYPAHNVLAMDIRVTDPLDNEERFLFQAQQILLKDGVYGIPTCRYYDPKGNVTLWFAQKTIEGQAKLTDAFLPNDDHLHWDYDNGTGLTNKVVDAAGKTTLLTYNPLGRVTGIKNPKGYTTTYQYASNGIDLLSVTDALGRKTAAYTYNNKHQPLTVTVDPDNLQGLQSTSAQTYESWGALATATDPNSQTTTYNYDSTSKRLTSIVRGGSTLASLTYDEVGRVRTRTDAYGFSATYEYNPLNRVTGVTYSDSTKMEIDTSCCGMPGVITDRSGRKTYYDYDALKRVVRMQDAKGQTLDLEYDANGNLAQYVDARGKITRFAYDKLNRLARKTYPNAGYEEFAYDKSGNVVTSRDLRGHLANYAYDANNNVTAIDYLYTADVSYSYNELDQQVGMNDALGQSTFTYDLLGRPTSSDGPWANDTVSYTYDNLGRRATLKINNTNQSSYAYDALGRLDGLTSPAGNFDYAYSGATGLISQLTLGNSSKTIYSYDSLKRLTQVHNQTGANANVSKYAYGYNTRGVRTYMENTVGADPLQKIDYGYDDVDQLTSTVSTETPTPQINRSWSYDAMGNRSTSTNTDGGQNVSRTYTTNLLNQYTGVLSDVNGNQINGWFGYWGGNLTSHGLTFPLTEYNYDDANRLYEVIRKDSTTGANDKRTLFVHDGLSRKALAIEYSWQNNEWVWQSQVNYVYDGMNVVQERDGVNNITSTYTRGLSLGGGIGGLLARTAGGNDYFYHYDGGGSVTQLTDSTQAVVAQYSYDPFGNLLSQNGAQANANRYRFSTKEYHAAAGLYDYGLRFYSPGMGRWINPDPIREAGGLNLYEFVGNSPTNSIDEYGLVGTLPGAELYFCEQSDYDPNAPWWDVLNHLSNPALGPLWRAWNTTSMISPMLGIPSPRLPTVPPIPRALPAPAPMRALPAPSTAPPAFVGRPTAPPFVIPKGASGPGPVRTGNGSSYSGGSGGHGLHTNVSNVRIMNPTGPKGPSPGYPNGYANYSNAGGQPVNPYTGKPDISPSHPMWHLD